MAEKDQAKIEADLQKLETVKVFHLHAGPGR